MPVDFIQTKVNAMNQSNSVPADAVENLYKMYGLDNSGFKGTGLCVSAIRGNVCSPRWWEDGAGTAGSAPSPVDSPMDAPPSPRLPPRATAAAPPVPTGKITPSPSRICPWPPTCPP